MHPHTVLVFHSNSRRMLLGLPAFYRRGIWGSQRLSDLASSTQLRRGPAGIWTRKSGSGVHALTHYDTWILSEFFCAIACTSFISCPGGNHQYPDEPKNSSPHSQQRPIRANHVGLSHWLDRPGHFRNMSIGGWGAERSLGTTLRQKLHEPSLWPFFGP